MWVKEKFNKKLLVEGNDDQHVVWALCLKFNIPETFDVLECGSDNQLIQEISIRFKQSEVNTVGIIIDADTDISNRWNSLKQLLTTLGFPAPNNLSKEGLILKDGNNKTIGVWIMPNNNLNGMLEDFISFLVPNDDQLLPIVNTTLDSIEERGLNKYLTIHRSKAAIHSWLAWQEDPGTPMGLGITKRYLTTDQETCSHLIEWLKKLFSE